MKIPGIAYKNNQYYSKSYYWKKRPSEIRGYNRVIYTTTDNGDYLRVDYNVTDKKVRLYLEDSEGGGNAYYSVILNGNVTIERNAISGRITGLFEKFNRRAHVFSTIPNREVLKLINKNYGIGLKGGRKSREEVEKIRSVRERTRREILEHTRRKYFKPDDYPEIEIEEIETEKKRRDRRGFFLVDLLDFSGGILLGWAIYYFTLSILAVGIYSASLGIILGFIDSYFRDREPMFTKIIFFVTAGIAAYIYGYYII